MPPWVVSLAISPEYNNPGKLGFSSDRDGGWGGERGGGVFDQGVSVMVRSSAASDCEALGSHC